jgi:1-acyl-sn-glycerol-3-phosphate acyltransferase
MASFGRVLRGVWRLGRVAAHVLRGVWIVRREFDGASAAHRCARIQWWSAMLLALLGLRLRPGGRFHVGPQLIVANHVSWLDIMAVHAICPQARFVSKADVKAWPLLGGLIVQAGTLFIERENRRDALRVVHQSAEALKAGDTVAFFPEGTTSDGHHLLPFHANLLQAAVVTGVPVQPLALRFSEPGHAVSPSAAYIGDTTLAQSLWMIACADGLEVHVEVLAPLDPAGLDRRALSQQVRGRIADALGLPSKPDAREGDVS